MFLSFKRILKNIKKEYNENYFYNAYDLKKLKVNTLNLNNKLHKKPKKYKDLFLSHLKLTSL